MKTRCTAARLRHVVELRARRQQGVLIKTLMADYGLGKTALYRYLDGVNAAVSGAEPTP
jgi:hypothetical protein